MLKNVLPQYCINLNQSNGKIKPLTIKQVGERLIDRQYFKSMKPAISSVEEHEMEIILLGMCLKSNYTDSYVTFNLLIKNNVIIGISKESSETINILGVDVPTKNVDDIVQSTIKLKAYAFVKENDYDNYIDCEAYYSLGLTVSDLSKKLKLKCQKILS